MNTPDWGGIVDRFVQRELKEKTDKYIKETHGLGCGCENCRAKAAVDLDEAHDRLSWRWLIDRWDKKDSSRLPGGEL